MTVEQNGTVTQTTGTISTISKPINGTYKDIQAWGDFNFDPTTGYGYIDVEFAVNEDIDLSADSKGNIKFTYWTKDNEGYHEA